MGIPVNRIAEDGIDIVVLVKGDERYVIVYAAATKAEALRTLGRWASDCELDFNWYNAAIMSQEIRKRASASA